jgi:hypothetical protein
LAAASWGEDTARLSYTTDRARVKRISTSTTRPLETRRFWNELVGSTEAGMSMQDMEGYEDLLRKLVEGMPPEQRAALFVTMPPEQRLEGLAPEQRLAGLDRDHQALALPLEVLRVLPEEYIRSLTADVQEEIRRRLRRADG